MFTIKFYRTGRLKILEAESFTILQDNSGNAEITLHRKGGGDDVRYDIISNPTPDRLGREFWPEIFDKAIIENSAGRTTEIIVPSPK